MTTPDTPTILLLFANDHRRDGVYLKHLVAEAKDLPKILSRVGDRVEVVTKTNVTRDEVEDCFVMHARQVIGVHFGGHAHPGGLFAQDKEGNPAELNVEGLARWFANMPHLEWVFLNGCATRAQVEVIRAHATVTVVATEAAIRDEVAVRFAVRFYGSLSNGSTIARSFADAENSVLLEPGDGSGRFLEAADGEPVDEFPWRLIQPANARKTWTLPNAGPVRRPPPSGAPAAEGDAGPRPPRPESAPLDALRRHLAAAHATLVPFFQPAHRRALIRDVYVELHIDYSLDPTIPANIAEAAPQRVTLERLMTGGGDLPTHGRWSLLGEPGAGKSTLARHIVWRNAADPARPLTLYVGVAEFADYVGSTDVADGQRDETSDEYQNKPFAFVEELVKRQSGDMARGITAALGALAREKGRLWVVFDGLDEVASERQRAIGGSIEAFAEHWEHVSIVVCSRPIGYETLAGFPPARIQPLDAKQQRQLVDLWLGEAAGARAFERIQAERGLRDAAVNPLLLSVMAKLASDTPTKALPASRSGLYDAALTLLLERGYGPEKRGLHEAYRSSARRLLGRLSFELTKAGGERWHLAKLEDAFETAFDRNPRFEHMVTRDWKTSSGLLGRVARKTGILGPHDGEGQRWSYLHGSLRERLAAEALAEDGLEAIMAHIRKVAKPRAAVEEGASGEPPVGSRAEAQRRGLLGRWGVVWGMACGLLDDPTEPLRVLADEDPVLVPLVLPYLIDLEPEAALDVLFGIEPRIVQRNHIWDGETLHRLAASWPLDEAVEQLTKRVMPALDVDRLAFVHYALTLLGRPPVRVDFFDKAGRPVDGAPYIPWMPIRPGLYRMGDPASRCQVHITAAFEMAATTVTVGQYRAFDPDHRAFDPAYLDPARAEYPVTYVSWWRAWLFAAWVGGALPTEAQWEYACRAGSPTWFWSGDDDAALADVGWFHENSGHGLHPVALKRANVWGLHDTHGNVDEWCVDGWGPALEARADGAPLADPVRPPTGSGRVLRGGSYFDPAERCRSSARAGDGSGLGSHHVGFRLVREPGGG